MSTNKTQIDHSVAEHFVQERFHMPDLALEQIADGETAQAFYFEAPVGPRVLRVSSRDDKGFHKDQFAYEHFNSDLIPIPKILDIGEVQPGLWFAVSERAPGKTLDKFSHDEIDQFMPKIIATLDAIHAIPPLGEGYGSWDLTSTGKQSSWRGVIEDDLRLDDKETTSADFYDANLAESLRNEIRGMLDILPEERKLVHRDFGFNNTLSDGENITGVIDWEHGTYGDFVYDIAWLDFWEDKQGYAAAFKKFYAEQGRDVPNFDERLVCYKLSIGLGSLGFFAKSRQADKYEYCKGIIARINRSSTPAA